MASFEPETTRLTANPILFIRKFMRPLTVTAVLILILFVLSSCGRKPGYSHLDDITAQGDESIRAAIRNTLDTGNRLHRVAWPIQVAAADMCYGTAPSLGIQMAGYWEFPRQIQNHAKDMLGHQGVYISWVADDSPAWHAGLRAGNQLITIQGISIASAEDLKTATKAIAGRAPGSPINLSYLKDDFTRQASFIPVQICQYPVYVVHDDTVNAYADGAAVYIHTGIMDFTENDDELAAIIGHELAHNTMGHIKKKQTNRLLGAALDALIASAVGVNTHGVFEYSGALAFSQDFEREADYVGLYMSAVAGYDIESSPEIWRRIGAEENPASINFSHTHPATPDRFLVLEKTVDEINSKIDAGVPLIPELK